MTIEYKENEFHFCLSNLYFAPGEDCSIVESTEDPKKLCLLKLEVCAIHYGLRAFSCHLVGSPRDLLLFGSFLLVSVKDVHSVFRFQIPGGGMILCPSHLNKVESLDFSNPLDLASLGQALNQIKEPHHA